ncbi:MAG: glycoside hydrolase family 127 protein, partial [Lentisphaeria bacterium]|nr:glycoside hydrolase family 127 protein [Lentisphaeria bacterium]
MKPLNTSDIKLHGEIAARLQRSVDNMHGWIDTRSGPSLKEDPGNYGWGADFQGRWTEAMAILSTCVDVPGDDLKNIADLMLSFQRADGNFHTLVNGMVQNGNSRALAALLEMYQQSGDRKYLRGAEKLAGWYDRNFKNKKDDSTWLTMALESIVALWQVTGKAKHLALAKRFTKFARLRCERPIAESTHAHSMALSIRGILAYTIASGDKSHLPLITKLWSRINTDTVWVTGGMPEIFTNSIEADEPCGTADCLSINLQLWQLTRKEQYLEAAENTLLNHLWFNQLPNGGFSSTSNLEQGFRGLEAWWCCSMHAPLGIEKFTRFICTHTEKIIWVNFFIPAEMTIRLKENLSVRIEQQTEMPKEPGTRLIITPEKDASFSLCVRIPEWTSANRITINGKRYKSEIKDGFIEIKRRWSAGDTVDVNFDMRMSVVTDIQGDHDKWVEAPVVIDGVSHKAKRIAIFWGPLVLAIFRPLHGNDLTWVYRGGYNEGLEAGGMTGGCRSSRNYIGLNGTVYSDDAENKSRIGPIKITVSKTAVRLQWREALGAKSTGPAELHYDVRVLPGLPVCIEEQEKLVIKATKNRPVKVDSVLLGGIRLTEKSEQYHDTYKRLWKYEYPPAQVATKGQRLKPIRDAS